MIRYQARNSKCITCFESVQNLARKPSASGEPELSDNRSGHAGHMEPPFTDDWRVFGFLGAPEPGVDYSWIEVQSGMSFIGFAGSVAPCRVLYASRKSLTLLVRPPEGAASLWSIRECEFELLSEDKSVVCVRSYGRLLHVAGVTGSFLALLVRWGKVEMKESEREGQVYEIGVPRVEKPAAIPEAASQITEPTGRNPVVLTGSSIMEEIQGPLRLTDTGVSVEGWSVDFEDIARVETTQIGRLFVVIGTKNGGTFEIGFDETDTDEGTQFYEILCKEVRAGQ